MKKILILILACLLIVTGCSSSDKQENDLSFTAGTYLGTGIGRNGNVEVEVVFDETSIISVEVTNHAETESIAKTPIERIPSDIVDNQTLNVDVVSAATITSDAIIEAVADCVAQAGGDVEFLENKEKENQGETETIKDSAQVVIVGGGGAGMAAALSAAEAGAESIIVIEKTATLGGNAALSGGYFASAVQPGTSTLTMSDVQLAEIKRSLELEPVDEHMSSWQESISKDISEYEANNSTYLYDSAELAALQYYEESGFTADPILLYDMCLNAGEVFEWVSDLGFEWIEQPYGIVGSMWTRWNSSSVGKNGFGYIELFMKEIEEKDYPVEYIMEVSANELIIEDGAVVGVKGVGADNTNYEIMAENGVILSTGGFSANPEMREEYNTLWAYVGEDMPNTNSPAMQGDGIEMAKAVDASHTDIGKIQLLPVSDPETGSISTVVGDSTNMYVNKEGIRFVDESGTRDEIAGAILEQTDGVMYIISSQENAGIDADGNNGSGVSLQVLLDDNKVLMADTLEELAVLMNVDPEVFVASVDTFNASVSGATDEFGRIRYNDNTAIGEGPYYACLRIPAAHISKGGLTVDVNTSVINNDGEVVKGLFAAGEVTGGRFRNGLPEAFTSGKTAGEYVTNINK